VSALSDPRWFDRAAVAAPGTEVVCRAVPAADGAILVARETANGTPVSAVTFRILTGPLAGHHAGLLLWPPRRPDEIAWPVEILAGTDDLSASLAGEAFRAEVETGPFGELEVRKLIGRAGDLPLVAVADTPEDETTSTVRLPEPPEDPAPVRVHVLRDATEIEEAAALLARAPMIALDIETACTRLPPERREERAAFEPVNGTVRLLQLAAWNDEGEAVAIIADCWDLDPAPLLRVLAEAPRVIAHNARFEQSWLAYRWDLALPDVFDTCAWWMIIARHLDTAGLVHGIPDARLQTLAARFCAEELDKTFQTSDWAREELSDGQLEYAGRDAAVLLPLQGILEEIGSALGCVEQADAASAAGARRALAGARRSAARDEDELDEARAILTGAMTRADLERGTALLRRMALSADSRERLGHLYRERLQALSPSS
jgi:ribonuclease D